MIKNHVFFLGLIFFFILPTNSTAEICQWTNIYDNDKVETLNPDIKSGLGPDGENQYESCEEATAKRQRQVERAQARANARNTITGGDWQDCKWTSPALPDIPSQTYTLTIEVDPDTGEPEEDCRSAQLKKQAEWIRENGFRSREDAEATIAEENDRQAQKAMSANEKAQKAAEKQQKTSLIATAGAMAAGVAAAACCSSLTCGACGYLTALSAGLGLAGVALGLASGKNRDIAADYQGGLLGDATTGSSGGTDSGETTSGLTTTGEINSTTGGVPEPEISLPTVRLPNGETVVPDPNKLGDFLKEKKLKWNPKEKSITLPDGRKFTADDTDNPEFRKYASSPEAKALKKQMKGLEKQITKALGDDLNDEAEEVADDTALGGGGFAGYDGGSSQSGGGGGNLMAALDRNPNSSNKNKNPKVAGMSVKMGKNQVGVRQDNIFEMIHRRYQKKRKNQNFIEIGR